MTWTIDASVSKTYCFIRNALVGVLLLVCFSQDAFRHEKSGARFVKGLVVPLSLPTRSSRFTLSVRLDENQDGENIEEDNSDLFSLWSEEEDDSDDHDTLPPDSLPEAHVNQEETLDTRENTVRGDMKHIENLETLWLKDVDTSDGDSSVRNTVGSVEIKKSAAPSGAAVAVTEDTRKFNPGKKGFNMTILHQVGYYPPAYLTAYQEFQEHLIIDLLQNYSRSHNGSVDVPFRYVVNVADYDTNGSPRGSYQISMGARLSQLRKRYREGTLNSKFISKLNEWGIRWNLRSGSRPVLFDQRIVELRQFRDLYGHCDVPKQWKPNMMLSKWVWQQRKLYRLKERGRKSNLTAEREARLRELGFDFLETESTQTVLDDATALEVYHHSPVSGGASVQILRARNLLKGSFDTEWNGMLEKLMGYIADDGDIFSLSHIHDTDPQLAFWVWEQHLHYNAFRGNTSQNSILRALAPLLTADRVRILTEAGVFNSTLFFEASSEILPPTAPHNDAILMNFNWEIMYKKLLEFHSQRDRSRVTPYNGAHVDRKLYSFTTRLQWEYKLIIRKSDESGSTEFENRASRFNPEFLLEDPDRVRQLHSIDSDWFLGANSIESYWVREYKWWQHYHELTRYKKIYGDCQVQLGLGFDSLNLWVNEQKLLYHGLFLSNGKLDMSPKDQMTESHYTALLELDFIFLVDDEVQNAKMIGLQDSSDLNDRTPFRGRAPAIIRLENISKFGHASPNLDLASYKQKYVADELAWLARCEEMENQITKHSHFEMSLPSTNRADGNEESFEKTTAETGRMMNPRRLGLWVYNQRMQYRNFLLGKRSSMTLSRIERLKKIGFDFNYPLGSESPSDIVVRFDSNGVDASIRPLKTTTWEKMVEELEQYKEINGNCYILPSFGLLGKWVWVQRRSVMLDRMKKYDRRKPRREENKDEPFIPIVSTASLTTEQINRLETIGLDFTLDDVQYAQMAHDILWSTMLHRLQEFKDTYGHCDVEVDYMNPSVYQLGMWTDQLRALYKVYTMTGTSSHLTSTRIKELDELGFVWDKI